MGILTIPKPNNGTPAGWTWEREPQGGNWGLELIRVPQMWNLNAALEKRGRYTVTGVLDGGFSAHPDLVYHANITPANFANPLPPMMDHGTQVAGIIGAQFNNGNGIDGINPFARLLVRAILPTNMLPETAWSQFITADLPAIVEARNDLKVVNISSGFNYGNTQLDPSTDQQIQNLIRGLSNTLRAQLITFALDSTRFKIPIFVVSAGNHENPNVRTARQHAQWNSPFSYLALTDPAFINIIVVESFKFDQNAPGMSTRSFFSPYNGHLSAPGENILSTSFTQPYKLDRGTSFAAPHVTGLISYLYSIDPGLTIYEIRQLLQDNSVPVGDGASNRIDAFASVMDIDRIKGNDTVLRMLLDIDDGSLDGNQRIERTNKSDFTSEDVDADGGIGDGKIDMSDFRRWRDWLLQIENDAGLTLDGSTNHPKKDVNRNGKVESPDKENIYPRGDFNGDGKLDRNTTAKVPGFASPVTDLQVLQKFFNDPNYQAAQLPKLIDSVDIEIWPQKCLQRNDVVKVESFISVTGSSTPLASRTHTSSDPRQIYTLPVSADGYTAKLEGRDNRNNVVITKETSINNLIGFGVFNLGGDSFWDPVCEGAVISIFFENGTPDIYQEKGDSGPLRMVLPGESILIYEAVDEEYLEFFLMSFDIISGSGTKIGSLIITVTPNVVTPPTPPLEKDLSCDIIVYGSGFYDSKATMSGSCLERVNIHVDWDFGITYPW